jgi:anthranilate synthase component I
MVYVDPAQPGAYARGQARLAELKAKLAEAVSAPMVKPTQGHAPQRDYAKADYIAAVERAKEMIAGGDFMQVQVGQRIKKRYTESPLSLYRALRSLNPSPYMYYYNFSGADGQDSDFHVVGASPEILVRQETLPPRSTPTRVAAPQGGEFALGRPGGELLPPDASLQSEKKITIRPLAGTRPRGATPELDKAAEHELVNDPKERAEHVMLIDLARNDIGRIAKIGTVKVTDAFCIERYSHVMHIVSNVEGTLLDGMTSMDVLKATFPAGTLTGAPKVHAMELIDQLEPTKRGIYGGACGYLSYAGDMDVAIAIRTGIIKNQTLYVQAAAGVVADSVPELEWAETEHKARALLRAAELVEQGLE